LKSPLLRLSLRGETGGDSRADRCHVFSREMGGEVGLHRSGSAVGLASSEAGTGVVKSASKSIHGATSRIFDWELPVCPLAREALLGDGGI